MWRGELIAIYITADAAQPMQAVSQARAVAGRGLEGDRYFNNAGTYALTEDGRRQVTLIEIEAIQALREENQLAFEPGESRRNLVTRGVPLNHLVDKEFLVGAVRLRGVWLCEPCSHLAELTGKPAALPGLVHRGGLRAVVLSDGLIRVGDVVQE